MSFEITTSFIDQFRSNLTILSQQLDSRFRKGVRVEPSQGKRKAFEFIGPTTASRRLTRHGDSPLVSTPHSRRWATLVDYEWGDLIDDQDKIRTLISPENPYARNANAAMNRAMDDEIIAAAFGTAVTGVDGATSTAWGVTPYDGTNPVAADRLNDDYTDLTALANTGTGLSLPKLRAARTIFRAREIDESQTLFLACSAQQIENLLQTTEATSADFTTLKALVGGNISSFMGFNFIVSERLELTGDNRRCIAWAQDGLGLGIGMDDELKISERADKSYSTYVYRRMTIGAVRTEDEKVLEIRCQEPQAAS